MSDEHQTATVTLCQGHTREHHKIRSGLGIQALRTQKMIEFDCRKADCGICLVKVLAAEEGAISKPQHQELDFLKAMHAEPDERLGCQLRIFKDVVLEVPEP